MADDGGTDDEDQWRFSVDEVGDDGDDDEPGDSWGSTDGSDEWGETADGERTDAVGESDDGPTVAFGDGEPVDDDSDDGGNVAGSVALELPVESGTPDLESAVFVAAGALLVLLVFASIVTPLTPVTIGSIALGVATVTAVLYAVFTRF